MVEQITRISYDNWKDELAERMTEARNVEIWFDLFVMGIDKHAREDDKLDLDLPDEIVKMAEDCHDTITTLVDEMSGLLHSK